MVYREWQVIGDPDSNKVKNQVERWKTLLPKLSNLTGNSCIFGDFNYCILNPCTDYQRQFDEIRDGTYVMLLLDGWAQMLETETRFQRGDKPSLLDHIYVNEIKYLERLYNRSLINSDHKVIGARICHDGQVHQPKTRDFRNIKGIEVDKFETSFKQKNLWKIFYEGDPDKALWRLTTKITQTLDELAPKRKRLCQTRGKEWIDDDMQALFDQRTVLHDTAKSSGSQDDWDVYKRFRNYVRNIARKTKDNFTRIFLNSDNVSTKWKRIKTWSGLEKKSSGDMIIQTEFGKTSSGNVLSSFMNKFFFQKVEKLKAKTSPYVPRAISYTERFMRNRGYDEEVGGHFYFSAVDWEVVMHIISNLQNTSSTGVDDIGTEVVKKFKNCLSPIIQHIVNLCLTKSIYPEQWKVGIISPIPKRDDLSMASNWRPIVLNCVMSKVLEHCMNDQMMKFVGENILDSPTQHAYRRSKSCLSALDRARHVHCQAEE